MNVVPRPTSLSTLRCPSWPGDPLADRQARGRRRPSRGSGPHPRGRSARRGAAGAPGRSRPGVRDPQHDARLPSAVARRGATRPPAGVWRRALSSRFSTSWVSQAGIAPHRDSASARHRRARPAAARPLATRSAASTRDLVQVDRRPASAGALVGAGQRQQALDQPAEALASPRRCWRRPARSYASSRGEVSATSASERITDRGVRSSCEASAVNRRCRSNARSSRSSIALKAAVCRPNSSSTVGAARRSERSSAPSRSAARVMRSTGRSARVARNEPPSHATTSATTSPASRPRSASWPSSGVDLGLGPADLQRADDLALA